VVIFGRYCGETEDSTVKLLLSETGTVRRRPVELEENGGGNF